MYSPPDSLCYIKQSYEIVNVAKCLQNSVKKEEIRAWLRRVYECGQNDPFGSTIKSLKDCALCALQCRAAIIINFAFAHSFSHVCVCVCSSMPFDIVYRVQHWNRLRVYGEEWQRKRVRCLSFVLFLRHNFPSFSFRFSLSLNFMPTSFGSAKRANIS